MTRILLAAAAFAALIGCKQKQAQTAGPPPSVPVTVAKATQESVPFEVRVVGSVEASSVVQVKSQVAGQLLRVHFTEGQNVAKGDLLFSLDARPFEEELRRAEAAVVRDRALVKQSESLLARDQAQSKLAEADADRYSELAKAGVIARAQEEQVRTSASVTRRSVEAAQAAIEMVKAALASNQTAVEKAKLDIAYTRITAPISGRAGNLLVNAGNLVKANDVPLVVLHQLSPIFVTFNVPEQHLATIRRLKKLEVGISSQDDPSRSVTGLVSVIDNTVDATTGTIKLKATLDNRNGILWPGQFVQVALTLGTTQDAVVVPLEAVQAGQQGQFVYVVKPDDSVEPRVVKSGRSFGERIIIESGVKLDETVVTDGQLRLFPGARIKKVAAK